MGCFEERNILNRHHITQSMYTPHLVFRVMRLNQLNIPRFLVRLGVLCVVMCPMYMCVMYAYK